jgi:signal transduction histidine kinase
MKAIRNEYCTCFLGVIGAVLIIMQAVTIEAWGMPPPTSLRQYTRRPWSFNDTGLLGIPQSVRRSADGCIWVSTENDSFCCDGMPFRKWKPSTGELPCAYCGIAQVSNVQLANWWSNPSTHVRRQVVSVLDRSRPYLSSGNPAQILVLCLWSARDYLIQFMDRKPQRIEAGERRPVFYTDLSPGRDLFIVAAANPRGIRNATGKTIAFFVALAWYQNLPLWLGMSLVVVLTLALAYLYCLRSRMRALRSHFDTRLEERIRLARDIHDTLLQTIQGSKMVVDVARSNVDDPVLTVRALDRLSDWLDRASHEGRAALESLRTSNDETADIVQALSRAALDCCVANNTKPTIATAGTVRNLHPIAQDEIYRIGYEAIRNACLHSNAGDLRVEVGFHRNFRLEISDNGQGISEETLNYGRPGHFGLKGMRECALQLGGKLEITSSPQRGTKISLRLPGHAVYKTRPGGFRAFLPGFFTRKSSIDKHKE